MSNGTSHSAAGQALGYLYQCMWALIELGRRAPSAPEIDLRLECLDDIQFDASGTPNELLQTKHHVGTRGALSIHSPDLWRTINVWMDLPAARDVLLRLVTTQDLAGESQLATLRSDSERDTEAAAEALCRAAQESLNSTTALWRQKFLEMDPSERSTLVSRIVIDDAASRAVGLDPEVTKTFRYAIPVGKEQVFGHLLMGWWAGVCVQLLSGTLHAVSAHDLVAQVNDIADQLKSDTLPVDPLVLQDYDESIRQMYQDRPFVQQLLWIALDNTRLWKAIRDYHRSYTLRSFWLRHQLLAEPELDRFAFRLHDEWEQIFDAQVAAMNQSGRQDRDVVGREVLEALAGASRARIRDRFDEPWFNRGILHALADGEIGQRIGWHPDFEKKLEDLLSHA